MTTIYAILSYGGLTLAVISLAVSITLFIKWKIAKVFGDLTGRTQKKAIERIQKEGYEATIHKSAAERKGHSGKITVRRTTSDDMVQANELPDEQTPTGQKRGESAATQEIKDAEVTTVLNAGLPEEETTILGAAGMEVSLVKPTADGVLLLPEETKTQAGTVVHILDLIVTHTGETIS